MSPPDMWEDKSTHFRGSTLKYFALYLIPFYIIYILKDYFKPKKIEIDLINKKVLFGKTVTDFNKVKEITLVENKIGKSISIEITDVYLIFKVACWYRDKSIFYTAIKLKSFCLKHNIRFIIRKKI